MLKKDTHDFYNLLTLTGREDSIVASDLPSRGTMKRSYI